MEIRIMEKLTKYIEKGQDIALITITNAEGSSPRGVGSMMLVDAEGRLLEGTIGGGAVEERAKQDGAACIKRGVSKTETPLLMLCDKNYFLTISTLLFLDRPDSERLSATGFSCPQPTDDKRSFLIPFAIRAFITVLAR